MSSPVRAATPEDIPRLVALLMQDAQDRHAKDPILWKLAQDAPAQIEQALTVALTAEQPPFQQLWQVAECAGQIVGAIHTMRLPVPPIYAGRHGEPGLILPDSCIAPGAPSDTAEHLLAAAEGALNAAGATIKLASFVVGEVWRTAFESSGYDPLTLYVSRNGLGDRDMPAEVRPATAQDVPGIVTRSAEKWQVAGSIDPFWEAHPDAESRFRPG